MKKEIWVYLETSPDDRLSAGTKDLLAQAGAIAQLLRGAVLNGKGGSAAGEDIGLRGILTGAEAGRLEDAALEAVLYGAREVTVIEGKELETFSPECCSDAFAQLLKKTRRKPELILFGRSPDAMDLAPALAARLDAGMLSDCVGAVPGPEGILWERHAFGGSAVSFVRFREEKTPIISVRPGSFGGKAGAGVPCLRTPAEAAAVPVTRFGYQPDRVIARPSLIRVLESAREQGTDIGSADVIVAGGNGAGPEGFALIRELAGLLHGAVGASRIAVDKGWVPHSQLIGQSGKTVAPRLYINCGISGSVQHIVGMRDAACVVSVNTDPRALIFNVSDYGIVGDLHRVLPELIREIRSSRG